MHYCHPFNFSDKCSDWIEKMEAQFDRTPQASNETRKRETHCTCETIEQWDGKPEGVATYLWNLYRQKRWGSSSIS